MTSPVFINIIGYVRAKQYKLRPERLTRLGNSNVLRLPVEELRCHKFVQGRISITFPFCLARFTDSEQYPFVRCLIKKSKRYLSQFNYFASSFCALHKISLRIYKNWRCHRYNCF